MCPHAKHLMSLIDLQSVGHGIYQCGGHSSLVYYVYITRYEGLLLLLLLDEFKYKSDSFHFLETLLQVFWI
jgi:hypothetical protein